MRVLGIEGTAWAASAAVYETRDPSVGSADEHVAIESQAYEPESGGLHPREAAEHMREAIPTVVEWALDHAEQRAASETLPGDADRSAPVDAVDESTSPRSQAPVDAVAFSRGPGLGPCLRITGTAARALAQRLDVPLVGVNHMLAHLEVGRHRAGFADPIGLNASGANAHVLGYRGGRYRVLGETMDTGVGNAIDKFAREVGWSHPGGPTVEAHAHEGEYVALPYVVKGMDFSFSGLSSAAQDALAEHPVEDVCRGLEETIFAMLTEVAERALALTGRDELVVGGGVANNARLQGMLREMAAHRGADLFVPEPRFLSDNAGMIAVLGAKQFAAGDTIAIVDSAVDSNYRPDDVPVTWRADGPRERGAGLVQGAEATVTIEGDRVVKERVPRAYRHPDLDRRLRAERTRQEARLLADARRAGVPTPVVRDVEPRVGRLVVQHVGERDLDRAITTARAARMGRHLARLHRAGIAHGDPTVRNARVCADGTLVVIDFGLGYYSDHPEDQAMDLHVFARSLAGTTDAPDRYRAAAERAYLAAGGERRVLDRVGAITGRGRYQRG
ncbi:MAG: bifunctional N(6)-L-threonylcarbamoyladenine synthase/serine/threonine protein kinase [Halococcoides sp.]